MNFIFRNSTFIKKEFLNADVNLGEFLIGTFGVGGKSFTIREDIVVKSHYRVYCRGIALKSITREDVYWMCQNIRITSIRMRNQRQFYVYR